MVMDQNPGILAGLAPCPYPHFWGWESQVFFQVFVKPIPRYPQVLISHGSATAMKVAAEEGTPPWILGSEDNPDDLLMGNPIRNHPKHS